LATDFTKKVREICEIRGKVLGLPGELPTWFIDYQSASGWGFPWRGI